MNDELTFAAEQPPSSNRNIPQKPWKVLIVDDDDEVHSITKLALRNFTFDGRGLLFVHAYSGEEAVTLMASNSDIAVCLLDVVMETDNAGLVAANAIRFKLNNTFVRIVLRTGQPGQAPEETIIAEYDINDYKEKTELTRGKLQTLMYSCLRSYRDIISLDRSKKGLERIIKSTAKLQETTRLKDFSLSILKQISTVISSSEHTTVTKTNGLAAKNTQGELQVMTGTGEYSECIDRSVYDLLPENFHPVLNNSEKGFHSHMADEGYLCLYRPANKHTCLVFVRDLKTRNELEAQLLDMFCRNALITFENISLRTEVEDSQRELVYLLGEATEIRSQETTFHLRRISKLSYLLAVKCGLSEEHAHQISEAAPLHDFGKIAIPDQILIKQGKLDGNEWDIMREHSKIGYDMLKKSDKPQFQMGALICLDHHERWDGTGYPNGKKGNEISIEGRITAVTDVFDTLFNRRAYKEPWKIKDIEDFFQRERGLHFDPILVDILFSDFSDFIDVQHEFPDPDLQIELNTQ